MADFSKQWCEKNDSQMSWDFDILEVAERLEPEFGLPYICEGFGFAMIAKNENGDIVLGFHQDGEVEFKFKTLEEVING